MEAAILDGPTAHACPEPEVGAKGGDFPLFSPILGRRPVIFGVRLRDGAFLSYPCLRTSAILDGRDVHASVKSSGDFQPF